MLPATMLNSSFMWCVIPMPMPILIVIIIPTFSNQSAFFIIFNDFIPNGLSHFIFHFSHFTNIRNKSWLLVEFTGMCVMYVCGDPKGCKIMIQRREKNGKMNQFKIKLANCVYSCVWVWHHPEPIMKYIVTINKWIDSNNQTKLPLFAINIQLVLQTK